MNWVILEKCLLWTAMVLVVAAAAITLCIIWGCEDTTPPEMKFLSPPIVNPINSGGHYNRLDAWSLDESGWPLYAAFGWTLHFNWLESGSPFTEPGIHVVVRTSPAQNWHGPVLEAFVTGSGGTLEGDPDEITAISGDDGVVRIYFGARNWPYGERFENRGAVLWNVCGFDDYGFVSQCKFAQENLSFFQGNSKHGGGFKMSVQGPPDTNPGPMATVSLDEEIMPDEKPMKLNPTKPLPRVLVDDILPALAECVFSKDYPPYRDLNATGKGILINVKWFKVKVVDGQWQLSPALFITPLPYGRDDVTSIAETAWPYTVCFHAPAESEGLGTVDAKLSIVDPNGVSLTTIDIQIHEVDRCPNCDSRQLWRSDYILPLAAFPQKPEPSLVRAGEVIVCWLPRGHTMKLDPVIGPRIKMLLFPILAADWMADDSIFDINGDGVVNFGDYAAFRR